MAILDTFYVLFKTNSEEIRKGYKDSEQAANSFAAGVDHVGEEVSSVGEHIISVFENVAIRIASAFAIEKLIEFSAAAIEVNAHLQETSERIGVAVEDLAALQSAATRFGGSADGVTASLDFLNRGMADIAVRGTSRLKPFFDELKVNPLDAAHKVKPLLQVYGDLADVLSKMNAQQRAGYGEKFGIDQGLILALAQGRRGFEDLINRQKELGVTTAEDAELADKFEQRLHDLGTVIHHIGNEAIAFLLPAISKIVDGFMELTQFLERHAPLLEGFFLGLGGIITTVYLKAISKAIIETAIWLAEVLLIPALIVAVAAAFGLAYDDVMNFLEGNKSVIGELSKRWPIVGETVRAVAKDAAAAFEWMVDAVKGGASLISSVINLVVAVFERMDGAISNFFRGSGKLFAEAFPLYTKMIMGTVDAVEALAGWIAKLIGWIGKFTWGLLADAPSFLSHLSGWLNSAAVSVNRPKLAMGGTAPTLSQRDAQDTTDRTARIARKFGPEAFRRPGSPATPGNSYQAPAVVPARRPAPLSAPPAAHQTPAGAGVASGQPAGGKPSVDDVAATLTAMKKAGQEVRIADATPIGALGNSTTNNASSISKQTTVNIENITVQTQASDPQAVAGAVGDHLTDHIRKAINAHDDGVAK